MSTKIDAPKVGRIHGFDLLRGYFLVVILINHLYYYPSGLDIFTGRGLLYVSSAEGFFLISGIVLGIVRGQKLITRPLGYASKLLLRRSFQLYVTYVVLTLLFTGLAWAFFMDTPGLKPTPADPSTNIFSLILSALTMQYSYGWADFLRLYVIFLAFSPLALWLLRRGSWRIMLAISVAVWALFPLTSGGYEATPLSWQLVFFSGLAIGFHWPSLEQRWHQIAPRRRDNIGRGLLVTAFVTASASAILVYGSMGEISINTQIASLHHVIEQGFNKDRLPVPRLLMGAIWFWGLFWLVRRYEAWFVRRIGWLLTPLGVNSLYVYTVQSFIVFFAHLFVLLPAYDGAHASWYTSLTLSLVALILIWFMVKRQFLFRIIPR